MVPQLRNIPNTIETLNVCATVNYLRYQNMLYNLKTNQFNKFNPSFVMANMTDMSKESNVEINTNAILFSKGDSGSKANDDEV